MKTKLLSLMGVIALSASTMVVQAQDYDDIYYDGSSPAKSQVPARATVSQETATLPTTSAYATRQPAAYRVTVLKNYQAERDVDEYNRRGLSEYDPMDTTNIEEEEGVFANTQRIERFYNPDIVVCSGDADLIEVYYDDSPTVNLVIGSTWGYSPYAYWGFGYGSYWYDPWYSWHSPWYGPGYPGYYWYRPAYAWYGWRGPYWYGGWSWGWGRPYYGGYYGWGGPRHYYGWGGYGHHRDGGHHSSWGRQPSGRRPGDGRSLLSGPARRVSRSEAAATAPRTTSRSGISGMTRSGANGGTRSGAMSNGRTRPATGSSGGAMSNGRTSASTRTGNMSGAGTRNGGSNSGGSMRNNRPNTTTGVYNRSGGSSGGRTYTPSSGSRSSNSGSGYSGSYSGGGSRGGFSGGGGSHGGGGRRH